MELNRKRTSSGRSPSIKMIKQKIIELSKKFVNIMKQNERLRQELNKILLENSKLRKELKARKARKARVVSSLSLIRGGILKDKDNPKKQPRIKWINDDNTEKDKEDTDPYVPLSVINSSTRNNQDRTNQDFIKQYRKNSSLWLKLKGRTYRKGQGTSPSKGACTIS